MRNEEGENFSFLISPFSLLICLRDNCALDFAPLAGVAPVVLPACRYVGGFAALAFGEVQGAWRAGGKDVAVQLVVADGRLFQHVPDDYRAVVVCGFCLVACALYPKVDIDFADITQDNYELYQVGNFDVRGADGVARAEAKGNKIRGGQRRDFEVPVFHGPHF